MSMPVCEACALAKFGIRLVGWLEWVSDPDSGERRQPRLILSFTVTGTDARSMPEKPRVQIYMYMVVHYRRSNHERERSTHESYWEDSGDPREAQAIL